MPTAVWCNSSAQQKMGATCNMVTTCLSPVFVQIGAIPSFMATSPTLRLPGKRNRWKLLTREANMMRTCDMHSYHWSWHRPSVHSCRCQGSSLRGLSFSAVCLLYSSAMLFLMYSWLSSVRCSSNHVVVFTVLKQPTKWAGLKEREVDFIQHLLQRRAGPHIHTDSLGILCV